MQDQGVGRAGSSEGREERAVSGLSLAAGGSLACGSIITPIFMRHSPSIRICLQTSLL